MFKTELWTKIIDQIQKFTFRLIENLLGLSADGKLDQKQFCLSLRALVLTFSAYRLTCHSSFLFHFFIIRSIWNAKFCYLYCLHLIGSRWIWCFLQRKDGNTWVLKHLCKKNRKEAGWLWHFLQAEQVFFCWIMCDDSVVFS